MGQATGKQRPHDRSAQIENEVGYTGSAQSGDISEKYRIDDRCEKRLDYRPRGTENRLLVLCDEGTPYKQKDQVFALHQFAKTEVDFFVI